MDIIFLKALAFKPSDPERGFTLVEVLVAILLITFFISVTLQGMVVAAIMKSRAQEFTEAVGWIQEDLEQARANSANYYSLASTASQGSNTITLSNSTIDAQDFSTGTRIRIGSDPTGYTVSSRSGATLTLSSNLASTQNAGTYIYPYSTTTLSSAASANATSITLSSATGFTNGTRVRLGSDSTIYTLGTPSGNTFPISPNLLYEKDTGSSVETSRCTGGTGGRATGFADGLRDRIVGSNRTTTQDTDSFAKTSTLTGRAFTISRTTVLVDASPFNRLLIEYNVTSNTGGYSVARMDTQLLPNVTLYCPP